MTNYIKSALDDYKLEYEDTNQPKRRKLQTLPVITKKVDAKTYAKLKNPKQPGIMRAYYKYVVEFITK